MAKLIFDCTGASAAPYTATPTLLFRLNVTEGLGERVDAVALRCQIRVEPHKRRYSPDEAQRLAMHNPSGGVISLHEMPDFIRLLAAQNQRG